MVSPMCPPSEIQDSKVPGDALQAESSSASLQRRLQLSLLRLGVECRVEKDEVTLSGTVSTYYEKQLAQEIVMKLRRFLRIKNRCVVKNEHRSDPR
jgi:osmotically-inducible protein OsmY